MPSDSVKLGELVRIKHGFAFKGEYFVDEPAPHVLVTPGNFAIGGGFQAGKLKYYRGPIPAEYVLKPGDLIVTMTDLSKAADTLGYGALVPCHPGRTYLHNQRIGLVEALQPTRISLRWLHYLMRTPEYRAWVVGSASGSTVKHTSPSRISEFQVQLPDMATQEACADALDALEARIDLLRQTNATLESIAQALFKSWFIDFDPVRALGQGREPEGMDAATAALFPAEFDESALGWLPRGWQVAAIRDVVENVYDGPHATPPEAIEGPVFLGIRNLTGTSMDLGDVRHIAEDDWAQWTRRVTPQPDDIVFSYEAALGLFALIPPGLRCCLGRRLALVRPKAGDGTPHFWFHQFVGRPFQQLLAKHTVQGATVNRIALKEFPSFEVMDPGKSLRCAFEAVARPLWARIHANRDQALRLAELRDTLLPRLISGKLRLPEAQEQLEDALA